MRAYKNTPKRGYFGLIWVYKGFYGSVDQLERLGLDDRLESVMYV